MRNVAWNRFWNPESSQPLLRVLRRGAFPNLEMQLRRPVYGIDGSDYIAGLDLVSRFHDRASQLAIEREIISMLHQDAFVISRHHHNLLHHSVENRLYGSTFCHGNRNAVVEWQLD